MKLIKESFETQYLVVDSLLSSDVNIIKYFDYHYFYYKNNGDLIAFYEHNTNIIYYKKVRYLKLSSIKKKTYNFNADFLEIGKVSHGIVKYILKID